MDTQVIIVGAGPVGLMLAAELRLGGARVVVLESRAEPVTESRASTLHARTMEIFDARGLLSRLGTPPSEHMGHFGGISLDFGAVPSRYPGQWKVPQAQVEKLLAGWAGELGAEIRRGHEVTGFTAAGGGVRVRAAGPAGPLELTAGYLVGCDGQDSIVRRLGGFAMPGRDATCELFRADVAGIEIRTRRFERLPRGMAIAGRLPSGATRIMVTTFARATARARPPDFAEVCAVWQQVTGEDISGGNPLWVNAFDNTSRLAERYRAGRVLLAGDAAHRQLPTGGQAINLGLQEAANLGWKLASEVSGRAPPGLLDSYHSERHEVARRVLGNIEVQSLLLLGDAGVEPLRAMLARMIRLPEVRDLLAGKVSGLDIHYECGEHPLAGTRMPEMELKTAQGIRGIATLLRAGRGLLLDSSALPARLARLRELTRAYPRTVALVPAAALSGIGPAAMPSTILVRPDGYVAWAGSPADDPGPALRRWFGWGEPLARKLS